MVANDNNWKKELYLLYLLYLLKVILALDLFDEIHKSCVNLHCQDIFILSEFKWKVPVKVNPYLQFFVYKSGTKYGKQTCSVAHKHN